jgi:hypothetical protein
MSEEVKSVSEKKKEDWMQSKWRPAMGWMYMVVCMFDMILFPVLWSLLQTSTGTAITQWNPLTLQGAGLFHIAMGAVLGIAAFGRTQEKLGGANNGGIQTQAPATGFSSGASTFSAPSTGGAVSTGFGSSSGFGAATPVASAPASSFGGGFGSAPATPAVSTPSTPTSTFALSETAAEPSGTSMGIKRPTIG